MAKKAKAEVEAKKSKAKKTRQPSWVPKGWTLDEMTPQQKYYYRTKSEGTAPYQRKAKAKAKASRKKKAKKRAAKNKK